MLRALVKIPAVFAMLIFLISFWFYILSIINPESENWEVSVFIALFSFPFYMIDALISFIKALIKKDIIFNIILAVLLVAAIPMLYIFGQVNNVFYQILWNVYYLAIFVLEIISIKRCITIKRK